MTAFWLMNKSPPHRFGPRANAAATGHVGHELVSLNAGDNGGAILWATPPNRSTCYREMSNHLS